MHQKRRGPAAGDSGTAPLLADWGMAEAVVSEAPQAGDEKIAVIGSGPAGLSAAYFLAFKGYAVTIFEKLPVAGGMMAVGIPEYRLPSDVFPMKSSRLRKWASP
jgi:NADPH-dependent glutamate synthase beta subunit-like oxidoreductase